MEGGLVKTILEIVGLRRPMQAIRMEGGLEKTILEIVAEQLEDGVPVCLAHCTASDLKDLRDHELVRLVHD